MNTFDLTELLACPCDKKSKLKSCGESLRCEGHQCGRAFPVVADVPILIHDESSIVTIQQVLTRRQTALEGKSARGRLRSLGKKVVRCVPKIGANWKSKGNMSKLRMLLGNKENPVVLVVGAGE